MQPRGQLRPSALWRLLAWIDDLLLTQRQGASNELSLAPDQPESPVERVHQGATAIGVHLARERPS